MYQKMDPSVSLSLLPSTGFIIQDDPTSLKGLSFFYVYCGTPQKKEFKAHLNNDIIEEAFYINHIKRVERD